MVQFDFYYLLINYLYLFHKKFLKKKLFLKYNFISNIVNKIIANTIYFFILYNSFRFFPMIKSKLISNNYSNLIILILYVFYNSINFYIIHYNF